MLNGIGGLDKLSNLTKLNPMNETNSDLLIGNKFKLDDNTTNSPMDMELENDLKILTGENNNNLSNVNSSQDSDSATIAKSFSSVLNNYVNNVNSLQTNADKSMETFASGGNIDMHSVMLSTEKANLSMQLTMQLRNKLLQAYQEISRMQA